MPKASQLVSLSSIRAADILALEVLRLTKQNRIDSRSPVADALLDYAQSRFGCSDTYTKLQEHVENMKR